MQAATMSRSTPSHCGPPSCGIGTSITVARAGFAATVAGGLAVATRPGSAVHDTTRASAVANRIISTSGHQHLDLEVDVLVLAFHVVGGLVAPGILAVEHQ